MSDDIETRPKDSNADAWHLFLSEYLDARADSPNGLTFMAVQIAEAIDDAERRSAAEKLPCGHHVSCLVKSVESTNQFCSFCDITSQRNDAEAMEETYRADRDTLRAKIERAKEAIDPLCNFAWSAVQADCDESCAYLNKLVGDLRTTHRRRASASLETLASANTHTRGTTNG